MKISKLLLAVVAVLMFFSQCKYDFIVPEEVPDDGSDTTTVVSFSNDIIPIFNDNDNCTQCHKSGGQTPNLTAGDAYSSINSSRYINKTNPPESLLYKHPNPDENNNHQKKYTQSQANKVLRWIEQGAKNN